MLPHPQAFIIFLTLCRRVSDSWDLASVSRPEVCQPVASVPSELNFNTWTEHSYIWSSMLLPSISLHPIEFEREWHKGVIEKDLVNSGRTEYRVTGEKEG